MGRKAKDIRWEDLSQKPLSVDGLLQDDIEKLRTILALLPVGGAIFDNRNQIPVFNSAFGKILWGPLYW